MVVVVEGAYSMDGDLCPIPALVELRREFGFFLMIDEAHSIGTVGPGGRGVTAHFGVDPKEVDILMGTLSKSMNSCGGYVAGNAEFITFLKYNLPGFVFSVGMSPPNTAAALASLRLCRDNPHWITELDARARAFREGLRELGADTGPSHDTPIVPLIVGSSVRARELATSLFNLGVNVDPITHPAVKERRASRGCVSSCPVRTRTRICSARCERSRLSSMDRTERVVITGMGAVSSLGHDVESFWSSVRAGVQAFVPGERVPWISPVLDGWDHRLRGTVRRQTDRSTRMALVAAEEALAQAGLLEDERRHEMLTVVGTSVGGIGTMAEEIAGCAINGIDQISPLVLPKGLLNMIAANISIQFGLRGESLTTCSACASGTVAIGEGFLRLSRRDADVAIVGGAEAAIVPEAVEAFRKLGALSDATCHTLASVPFSTHRSGFVIGEGAGMLVLERESHARARGARVLGQVVGYGGSSDAYHRVAPHPDGMRRAIMKALAGVRVEDIGYVNAHGTSTRLNDSAESTVIAELLPHDPPVSSTKACHGHALGAAGALEAIATIKALQHREVIANHGVPAHDIDPDISINIATAPGQQMIGDLALSNSFAFGGQNAALVRGR